MQYKHIIVRCLNVVGLHLKAALRDLKAEQIFYILQKVFLHAFAYGDGYIPVYVYFNFLFPANTLNVIGVN